MWLSKSNNPKRKLAHSWELIETDFGTGAELVGISVDGAFCHQALARDHKLAFPLLSDFEPKGDVARRYGVYRGHDGHSERALFVIDGDGVIRWSYVSPVGVNPGADGILTALEALYRSGTSPWMVWDTPSPRDPLQAALAGLGAAEHER